MGYRYGGNNFAIDDDPDEPYYEPGACGTYAGYRTHARNKTTPCDICKKANGVYNREWYAKNKKAA